MSTPLIVPYRRHPLSCALPTYEQPQLDELTESIKRHGLRHRIIVHQGMILDGWNRLNACVAANVAPEFRELTENESAASVVLNNNIDRRDLTKCEKAFAVVDIFFIVNDIWSVSTHALVPEGSSAAPLHWSQATVWKQTKAQLAARVGVKPRMMQDVLRIRARGEKILVDAVRSGEISVEEAAPMVAFDMDGQYMSLQNHREGKAAKKAKLVVKKREEAAARSEKKRASKVRSIESNHVDESTVADATDPPSPGNGAKFTNLRALVCETESRLKALCDALGDSRLIAGCEGDAAGLARACQEYLALMESR